MGKILREKCVANTRNRPENNTQEDIQSLLWLNRFCQDSSRLDNADIGHLLEVHIVRDSGLLEFIHIGAVIFIIVGDFAVQTRKLLGFEVKGLYLSIELA